MDVRQESIENAKSLSELLSESMNDQEIVEFFFKQLPFPHFPIHSRIKKICEAGIGNKWLPIEDAPKDKVVLGITENGDIQFVSYYAGSKKWLSNAFEKNQAVVGYRTLESLGKFVP